MCLYIQNHYQIAWFFKFFLTVANFHQYGSQDILVKEFEAFEILAKIVIVKSHLQSVVLEEKTVHR